MIGSKEAAGKVCSQIRHFMEYHLLTAVLQTLLTLRFLMNELEVQAREGGPGTKHGLEDDLGCG